LAVGSCRPCNNRSGDWRALGKEFVLVGSFDFYASQGNPQAATTCFSNTFSANRLVRVTFDEARISAFLPVDISLIITRIIRPCKGLALRCSRDSLGCNPKKVVCSVMIDVMEEGVESRRVSKNPYATC
jgi:hypothetical protein